MTIPDLVEAFRSGSRRALARALTLVERENADSAALIAQVFPHTGKAWVIGVTGAPGTGKSSLVNAMTKLFRQQGETVAIVAVDPTSPFSGGAILGDRIRMRDLSGDKGVFIRSMATRGSLGGLARATRDMVRVLDAAGFDWIIVETVGAGQSEVDIVRTAHTTLVVEAPGLGDDIQTIKAGILEIADILVVNKSDRPDAKNTVRALQAMLELGHPTKHKHLSALHVDEADTEFWVPPVLQTNTLDLSGVANLIRAIESHQKFLQNSKVMDALEKQRIYLDLDDRLRMALMQRLIDTLGEAQIMAMVVQVQSREIDPHGAIQRLLAMQAEKQTD